MRHLLFAAAIVAGALAPGPAFADAKIYRGTLGEEMIVVELASTPGQPGDGAGRYFYLSKGVDIPLDPVKVAAQTLDDAEEKPCTDNTCRAPAEGEQLPPPPIGARWHLTSNNDGSVLTGSRTDSATGGSLPIALKLVGSRPLSEDFNGTPSDLEAVTDDFAAGGAELSEASSPYDFIRYNDVTYARSAPITWNGASFEYWTDPRTTFAYPRITDLGGADNAAANHYLEQQHWMTSAAGFVCESLLYQGLGRWMVGNLSADTIRTMEDARFKVTYLSPTVMSYLATGKTFCAGAHPDNHYDYYNLDVRTGKPLDLSLVFKGWVPTTEDGSTPKDLASARAAPENYLWGPDKTLEAFVTAHTPRDAPIFGRPGDASCTSDDLFATNLDITFVNGEQVRFAVDRIPSAIAACGGDLFDIPIAELKELLTPEAANYFPSLAGK